MAKTPDYELDRLIRKLEDQHGAGAVRIVESTVVLWEGWEGDTRAVIYELHASGTRRFACTDHGRLVEMDLDQGRTMLKERAKAYEKALRSTQAMIALTA